MNTRPLTDDELAQLLERRQALADAARLKFVRRWFRPGSLERRILSQNIARLNRIATPPGR